MSKKMEEMQESEETPSEEEELVVDLFMARFEDLMERRPLLLNSVLLRQNPHNVVEWLKRVELLEGKPNEVINTLTEAVQTVDPKQAEAFGLMRTDENGTIKEFREKPKGDSLLEMAVDTSRFGLSPASAKERPYLASMGIYVFSRRTLFDLLDKHPGHKDFGKEIIPEALARGDKLQSYVFDDYWEDIGTIGAFYEANLALTQQPTPPFSFYDEKFPIYTRPRYLPPSKLVDVQVTDSIIGEGSILKSCSIQHCVLGVRSRVESDAVVQETLVMGADYFESSEERALLRERGGIPLGVGEGTTVKGAILDKNARIGSNVTIVNKDHVEEADRPDEGFYIRNGIVVVVKNATISDGTVI